MPELPEVEIIVRSLQRLVGLRVYGVTSYTEKYDDVLEIHDRVLNGISRRGKFIIFDFGDKEMIVSLGMTGKLVFKPTEKESKHKHVWLEFINPKKILTNLFYCDVRKFGTVRVVPKGEYTGLLSELGPEPLSRQFIDERVHQNTLKTKKPIKAVLLEQKFAAGIGNYLADEILFRSCISPERRSDTITRNELGRLIRYTQAVINESIASGGNSFSDYVDADGNKGGFFSKLKAYGREGEVCLNGDCSETIQRKTIAGRSTFFCPKCQK